MATYILKHKKNSIQFLRILDELLDIYATFPPKFFKSCLLNLDPIIYDKIVDLSLSKSSAKSWTARYTMCVSKSKQLMTFFNYTEQIEVRRYCSTFSTYIHSEAGRPTCSHTYSDSQVITELEKMMSIY